MSGLILFPILRSQKFWTAEVAVDGRDIISTLPDNILLHILSFLPMKDVLRTSALSRRWKHLCTCISDIKFNEFEDISLSRHSELRTSFLNSLDRVLLLHDSSCIKKFCLLLYEHVSVSRVSSWLSAAVNHMVQELDLSLQMGTVFVLPDSLFTSESLTKLKLYLHFELPSLIHFSNLKVLNLRVRFPGEHFAEQFFSGCPALEELSLDYCNWQNIKKMTISIPTLRKLSISCMDYEFDCVLTIYAENLLYLECINCLAIELTIDNVPSLTTAYIHETNWEMETCAERVVKLLHGICNVKSLTLEEMTLECLAYETDLQASLPTFHRLTHFKVEARCEFERNGSLIYFLQKSPNLESLDIPKVFYNNNDWFVKIIPLLSVMPQCLSSCLKTVAIFIEEMDNEIPLLIYLLENAKMLEMIKVSYSHPRTIYFVKHVIKRLQEANRIGSTGCMIEFCKTK